MNWFAVAVFKLITYVPAHLPRAWQVLVGRFLGWLWFDLLRIRRGIVLENIRQAYPEWSQQQVLSVARESMSVVGQNIVDVALLPHLSKSKVDELMEVEGLRHVEEALRQGKGMFLLTLHMGSGDMIISCLNYLGLKIQLISKEFRTQWLNRFWFSVRSQQGTQFIGARRSSFDILRALKRNEIVIFLLDQYMGPPLGVATTFFGRRTGTAMGLALIAERSGAPVVPAYTYLLPNGKSKLIFLAAIPFQDQSPQDQSAKEGVVARMTQLYTDKIEEIVKKHPGQWLWVHRRWKDFREN